MLVHTQVEVEAQAKLKSVLQVNCVDALPLSVLESKEIATYDPSSTKAAEVSSGAVSNQDPSHGYSCITGKRALETQQHGKPMTAYMKHGDTVRLDMRGRDGLSVFGAIEQEVVPPAAPLTPRQFA